MNVYGMHVFMHARSHVPFTQDVPRTSAQQRRTAKRSSHEGKEGCMDEKLNRNRKEDNGWIKAHVGDSAV